MKRYRGLMITLLALFFVPLLMSAQANLTTGILMGFIYKDDCKTPVWGAQVLLESIATGSVYESNVTDSTGDYKIEELPPGDYIITILARDKLYKVRRIDYSIKIFEGKTTTLSFCLKKRQILLPFLRHPCGIAAVIAGTTASLVTIEKIRREKKRSPTER